MVHERWPQSRIEEMKPQSKYWGKKIRKTKRQRAENGKGQQKPQERASDRHKTQEGEGEAGQGEERGSEGRWREKIDSSLQTCAVCWVMLGHRCTNLY